jgi:hypothetical protein
VAEVADVRRRVRQRITEARERSNARRLEVDAAGRQFASFLSDVARPLLKVFASALTAEGYPFTISTPAEALRLTPERSRSDFIEIGLDTSLDPPQVIGRTQLGRGARGITRERPVRDNKPVDQLSEGDLLDFLVEEIGPFLER